MKHILRNIGLAGIIACFLTLNSCTTTSTSIKSRISSAERAEKKGNYREAAEMYKEAEKEITYKIAYNNLNDLKKSAELDEKLIDAYVEDVVEDADGNPMKLMTKLMARPFIDPFGTLFTVYTSKDLVEKKEEIKEYEKTVEALKEIK